MRIFIVVAALALAGCASTPDPIALANSDRAVCQAYGYADGSPEMERCLLQQVQTRQADQAARRQLAMQYLATQYRPTYTPNVIPIQGPSRMTTCNSTPMGGSVTTTCY